MRAVYYTLIGKYFMSVIAILNSNLDTQITTHRKINVACIARPRFAGLCIFSSLCTFDKVSLLLRPVFLLPDIGQIYKNQILTIP